MAGSMIYRLPVADATAPHMIAFRSAMAKAEAISDNRGYNFIAGFHGAPLGAFEFAVVVRAVVLVACLVAWVLGERGRHALGTRAKTAVDRVAGRARPAALEAPA